MNSRSFENIETQIKDELKKENVFEKLYNSTDYILNIINTIVETDGINWASKVMDDKGNNVLTEEEQAQFTSAFQPYINSILSFFGKSNESTMGGALTDEQKRALMSKSGKTVPVPVVPGAQDDIDIDEIFMNFMNNIDRINKTFKNNAPILQFQNDMKIDPVTPIGPIPVRTIIFALYLLIDILRVMASASGMVPGRKILSIVMAIFDLLKGDWKKAILSFMGFFSSDILIIGAISKIFLSMFETINPDRQESIIYGAYGTIKSLLVGILLSILQIGAPMQGRDYIMQLIKDIDNNHEVNSWDDINNIQMIFDNPKITCNNQFQESLKSLPSIVKIVAQLLSIPKKKEVAEGEKDEKVNKTFNDRCKEYKIEGEYAHATSSAHLKMEESKKLSDKKMEEYKQKSTQGIAIVPSAVTSGVTPKLGEQAINIFMEKLLQQTNLKTEALKVINNVIEGVLNEQGIDKTAIQPLINILLTRKDVEKQALKVVKGLLTQNPNLQKQALNEINNVIQDVLNQQNLDPTILKLIEKILTQTTLEPKDINLIKTVLKQQRFDPAIVSVIEKLLKQEKLQEKEFKPLINVVLKQLGLDPKILPSIEKLLTKPPTTEKEIQKLIFTTLKQLGLDNKQIKLAKKIVKDPAKLQQELTKQILKQSNPLKIHF